MARHNNWLTTNLSNRKQNKDLDFKISFNSYPSEPMSFQKAADYTANLIAEKYNNLWLSFSGGIDSEFVANVLFRNGIDFTPITYYDIKRPEEAHMAMYWCQKHNKELILIEGSDEDENFQKKLFALKKYYNLEGTIAAIVMLLASIANKNNGHLITGFGDPFDINNEFPEKMTGIIELPEWDFYSDLIGDNPGGFFCYTKEIMKAFIQDIDYTKSCQEAKSDLYNIPFRPKVRGSRNFTLKELNQTFNANCSHIFGFKDDVLTNLD